MPGLTPAVGLTVVFADAGVLVPFDVLLFDEQPPNAVAAARTTNVEHVIRTRGIDVVRV